MKESAMQDSGFARLDAKVFLFFKWVSYVAVAALIFMAFLMTADVIGSKLFGRGISIAVDLATYMVVVVIYMGAPCANLYMGQINVDILLTKFPKICKKAIDTISSLLMALTMGIIAYYGWDLASYYLSMHTRSTKGSVFGGFEIWPFAVFYALGATLFVFSTIWVILRIYLLPEKSKDRTDDAEKEAEKV